MSLYFGHEFDSLFVYWVGYLLVPMRLWTFIVYLSFFFTTLISLSAYFMS